MLAFQANNSIGEHASVSEPAAELERTGTHHHALDDARCQAMHLMQILAQTEN